jgi:hypothetical protein
MRTGLNGSGSFGPRFVGRTSVPPYFVHLHRALSHRENFPCHKPDGVSSLRADQFGGRKARLLGVLSHPLQNLRHTG